MTSDLLLRRKWTLRAHGQQVVFIKKSNERGIHVLMKAFLWAMYLPIYPNLQVEIQIGDRYKPDVVALHAAGVPTFWGEAGQVSVRKIRALLKRYPHTHFAIAKWDTSLRPHIAIVEDALADTRHTAPVDLIAFPVDSAAQFISEDGNINLTHDIINWVRLGAEWEQYDKGK